MKKIRNFSLSFFKNKAVVGYTAGFLAVFIYSLMNILSQTADAYMNTSEFSFQNSPIVFAVLFVTVKELVAVFAYFLLTLNHKQTALGVYNAFKINWKKSVLAGVAGIFGGTLGFSLTTAGGLYLSSGVAGPFYSIEIIIVFFVAKFLFKRKGHWMQYLGFVILVIAITLNPLLNYLFSTDKKASKNIIAGAVLLVLGVTCWAVESLIFDKITEFKKIPVKDYVSIKQIFSAIVGVIFTMPLLSFVGTQQTGTANPAAVFIAFKSLFYVNWRSLLIMVAVGFMLYVGRRLFFASVALNGGTTANGIYNFLGVVQIALAAIANQLRFGLNVDYLGKIHHEYFWALSVFVLIGILLAIFGQLKSKGAKF